MSRKTPNFDEVQELGLTDFILCNAFIDGRLRTRMIQKGKLTAGASVVAIEPGTIDITEEEHLGRLLDIDNQDGEVILRLPDHSAFNTFGMIFWAHVQNGSNPVSVTCATLGQLKAPQHSSPPIFETDVFIGPRTDLAEQAIFAVFRSESQWQVLCATGVRDEADVDNSLAEGTPGTLTFLDEGVTVAVEVEAVNIIGARVTAEEDAEGVVNLTFDLDEATETTLTFADPLGWDVVADPRALVTLTGNTTINASEMVDGNYYTLSIVQDGTGGRTVAFSAGFADSPAVNDAAGAVTVLQFYATGGELQNVDNVGDPQTIGDLNAITSVDAEADFQIIERGSDNEPLKIAPRVLFSAIVAPIDEDTDARTLLNADHNRVIECSAASTEITVDDNLSPGFTCLVVNKTGEAITFTADGVTIVGATSLGDDHFATIYVGLTEVVIRASG